MIPSQTIYTSVEAEQTSRDPNMKSGLTWLNYAFNIILKNTVPP